MDEHAAAEVPRDEVARRHGGAADCVVGRVNGDGALAEVLDRGGARGVCPDEVARTVFPSEL